MKNKKDVDNKKRKTLLILLVIMIIAVMGITYALWQLTLSQTGTNQITTACFKIEFEGQNDINLENAFPVSDEEGKKLTPYDFTITNVCKSEANYYVNLETVTTATKKLSDYYLKANLLKGEEEVFLANLNSSYINTERVIATASDAYKLYQGYLKANETATFHLNLWLDDTVNLTDEAMNATYEGKITVTTTYKEPVAKNLMVAMEMTNAWDPGDKTNYKLNNTYTNNEKYLPSDIEKVVFENTLNPYEEAIEVVDFSEAQDRSILGYYVKNEADNKYILHIQSDGKIKVNKNGSYYFCVMEVYGINYFEGIENLDTSLTTDMSNMFNCTSNDNLDLSNFDTSNVTNMNEMFRYCTNLTNLDLSVLDTSKVTDMARMFENCTSLTTIYLNQFNTSQVTTMYSMFSGCRSLTTLDLSSFDTTNVTNMSYMFSNCSKLTTSITIMNSNTTYSNIFYNAATEEGSQITVNYTAETSDLVDQMITTKSENSNVIKGELKS